ncbi:MULTISPECIES: hypothetical protein [unclassified Sphingomonas]|uniref:hypothetical protein n=1 Tax=Sphingomonas TaxID=13687 RepID=UPI000E7414E4|nr:MULTISPECIES: hypothetical protein [unclassified Sphingomonas]RKE53204.1 hypothetical protein C8J39_0342 [Sphingomonas sp. PP-CC-1A-547]TCM09698.1 hypothetical protein C8J41_101199 [Sphingomonas sp. PP-CC-3G-468]
MIRRIKGDRRDRPVAAVTPGPDRRPVRRFEEDRIELPIILVAALEETGTGVDRFLERLQRESIWQAESIRSADGEIDIQAHLAPEGLRCVVRIGKDKWYHHPLDALHAFGLEMPATDDGGLAILELDPLLNALPLKIRYMRTLNDAKPGLGTCLYLIVPRISFALRY